VVTLLLVDDEEMNRDMLARRLTRRGYHVIVATDGGEACTKALEERPALILMDMRMPVVDGYEAIRRIRGTPEIHGTPIIGLTAQAMAGDCQKVLDSGCNDYEPKPIEFPRLLEKIELLLRENGVS
jgi:two-component system, cell cycle response regulator DivK